MQKCIVGRKLGMTQLFDENGKFIPVTVVEAGPCVVVQKKTIENDGYEAVQIGFGEVTSKHVNKPLQGHFAKSDVAMKKVLREFRLDDCAALNVGDLIKADVFANGDKVETLRQPQPQSNPRYRPGRQPRRFQRRLFRPFPCIQGQRPARPHGC